ncbi:MAG: hypothetical protein WC975_11220 [Phycisphaerae bacterium]
MKIDYQVHDPLLSRLVELAQQRPFYDQPNLGWITGNYLDKDYLRHLMTIGPGYGVKYIVFDDFNNGYFDWGRDLLKNPSVGNWLAESVCQIEECGLHAGILTEAKIPLRGWLAPVAVFTRKENVILDGITTTAGRGQLPYLAIDTMIGQIEKKLLIRIDQPGSCGPSLPFWANIFGISFRLFTGISDPVAIENEYAQICFGNVGPEIREAYHFARLAIQKSFWVFDAISMMDNGRWPENLQWFDNQIGAHPSLSNPTQKILDKIDLEKIEALEFAHDAWRVLTKIRPQVQPEKFLWLEHYFLHLKIIALVLRTLADTYFSLRGLTRGSLKIPTHAMRSKFKVLTSLVREYPIVLSEFDARTLQAGAGPLATLLAQMGEKITNL